MSRSFSSCITTIFRSLCEILLTPRQDVPKATKCLLPLRLEIIMTVSEPQVLWWLHCTSAASWLLFLMRKHSSWSFRPTTVWYCGKELFRDEQYWYACEIFAAFKQQSHNNVKISTINARRHAIAQLVEALCYKPESFDSRWGKLFFLQLPNPSNRTMTLELTQPLKEMSTNIFFGGGKAWPERKTDNLTAICEPIV
jgi:hypothetical protein